MQIGILHKAIQPQLITCIELESKKALAAQVLFSLSLRIEKITRKCYNKEKIFWRRQ